MANSNMESSSGDCITCSDTDEVTIRTACKRYRKRVWASCRLGKGILWSETQLKQIGDSCQAMWGHDHEIIRTEQDHALEEDCNSFEMHKMTVMTDQLFALPRPPTQKFTPGNWRLKPMAWQNCGIVIKTILCPLLLVIQKGNN